MRSMSMNFLFIFLATVACQRPVEREECFERTYEHAYGLPVKGDQWEECGRNGKVFSSLRNGVSVTQTYADGILDGESTYTYPLSNQIERVETYSKGQLVEQVFYSCSGNPDRSVSYTYPDIRTITEWYEHGNPRAIETFDGPFLVSGQYYSLENLCESKVLNGSGERTNRNDLGDFLGRDVFQDGRLVQQTTYYSNGSPKEICSVMDGVLHGERKKYYPGGEPQSVEQWQNGCQSGLTTIFQNGEKYAEVPYHANMKHGVERRYRDGCFVTHEISWMNDMKHGQCKTYISETVETDWYYKGRLSTKANFESFALPRG